MSQTNESATVLKNFHFSKLNKALLPLVNAQPRNSGEKRPHDLLARRSYQAAAARDTRRRANEGRCRGSVTGTFHKPRRLWPIQHVLPSRQVSPGTAHRQCPRPVPIQTQLRANCLPCIPGGVRWPVSVRGCAGWACPARPGADRSKRPARSECSRRQISQVWHRNGWQSVAAAVAICRRCRSMHPWPCLVRKIFQDSPSHRILRYMHGALNIHENKNYLHSSSVNREMNLLSLVTL